MNNTVFSKLIITAFLLSNISNIYLNAIPTFGVQQKAYSLINGGQQQNQHLEQAEASLFSPQIFSSKGWSPFGGWSERKFDDLSFKEHNQPDQPLDLSLFLPLVNSSPFNTEFSQFPSMESQFLLPVPQLPHQSMPFPTKNLLQQTAPQPLPRYNSRTRDQEFNNSKSGNSNSSSTQLNAQALQQKELQQEIRQQFRSPVPNVTLYESTTCKPKQAFNNEAHHQIPNQTLTTSVQKTEQQSKNDQNITITLKTVDHQLDQLTKSGENNTIIAHSNNQQLENQTQNFQDIVEVSVDADNNRSLILNNNLPENQLLLNSNHSNKTQSKLQMFNNNKL